MSINLRVWLYVVEERHSVLAQRYPSLSVLLSVFQGGNFLFQKIRKTLLLRQYLFIAITHGLQEVAASDLLLAGAELCHALLTTSKSLPAMVSYCKTLFLWLKGIFKILLF